MKKTFRKKTFVAIALWLMFTMAGRAYCQTTCSAAASDYVNHYSRQASYIPNGSNTPLITLKITLHVFYYIDNNNNWHGNWIPASLAGSNDAFNGHQGLLNALSTVTGDHRDRYSDPIIKSNGYTAPNWPPANISDSRVRYEVTNIYYYNDKTGSLYDCYTNGSSYLENYINGIDANRLNEGMPVFIKVGIPYFGYSSTLTNGRPYMVDCADANDVAGFRENFVHELGHCFGLMHTYYGDDGVQGTVVGWPGGPSASPESPTSGGPLNCSDPDYLTDVFPLNNPQCGSQVSWTPPPSTCASLYEFDGMGTNNLMSGVNLGAGVNLPYHSWMSPLQMGRRIRSMRLDYHNLRYYAKDVLSDHVNTWNITGSSWNWPGNEVWDFDVQMYEDIVVKSGHTLTIKCRVSMPTDGKIIVEKGARLVIDGGVVTGWCKSTPANSYHNMPLWEGIEVDGNPAQNQLINNTTGYCPNQGIVEIRNGGKITNAFMGINTSRTNASGAWINNTGGGIVLATNSTFENNVFDIVFYKYQQGVIRNKVENCQFITTGAIGYDGSNVLITPHEHIKLYENWGLTIKGCSFINAAGTTYPLGSKGVGVYATDSYFTIDQLNANTKTNFGNLNEGAYVDNTNPIYTATIRNCIFSGNRTGFKAENCNYLMVYDNRFNVSSVPNYSGAYLYKCKYYNVRNNSFVGANPNGSAVGIIALESGDGFHQIYRNTFVGLNTGILPQRNNGGLNPGTNGLQLNCNVFNSGLNNLFDIAMTYNLGTPIVMSSQSPPYCNCDQDGVGNLYGAPHLASGVKNKWFVDNSYNGAIIHYNSPGGPDDPSGQSSPQVGITQLLLPINYTNRCPAWTASSGGSSQNSMLQKLAAINAHITDMRSAGLAGDAEIQASVSSKMNLFLTDTMPDSNDSIIAILSNNQGNMSDAGIQLIMAYQRNGDYVTAGDLTNQMPASQADWKSMLQTMSTMKQYAAGIYSYLGVASNISYFTNYANTNGKDGQACAEAILSFAGQPHDFPMVYPSDGSSPARMANSTGLSSVSGNQSARVYPNPASSAITLEGLSKEQGLLKLEVVDVLGKTVVSETITNPERQSISLNGLIQGVYIVKVNNEKKQVIFQSKIIKQD